MRNQLFSSLVFTLLCNYALAQDSGQFTSKDLPNNSLPKVSVNDAPIKPLEINKSALIKTSDSISSLLLNNKVSSLMFTDEEESNVERALDAFKNNQSFNPAGDLATSSSDQEDATAKQAENEKSFIYLSSIIYFTTKDWAVWINDQKITPSINKPDKELYLTSVRSNSVKLIWKVSLSKWRILSGQKVDATPPNLNANNQVEFEFELQPNQTFSLKNNKVTEGRALPALLQKKATDNKVSSKSTLAPTNSGNTTTSTTTTTPNSTPLPSESKTTSTSNLDGIPEISQIISKQ